MPKILIFGSTDNRLQYSTARDSSCLSKKVFSGSLFCFLSEFRDTDTKPKILLFGSTDNRLQYCTVREIALVFKKSISRFFVLFSFQI
jgi:hypothetical protein